MIVLALVSLGLLLGLFAAIFLLGFRVGGGQWQEELAHVRLEAALAQRQMHNLTRQAFVAMAEQTERHRSR